MITVAQAQRIALSMPGAEQGRHMGHPDFRVGNKIFATLWPNECRAVVKLCLADQSALLQMDSKAFSLNAWSHQGWTNVHLQHVTAGQLRYLVQSAWRLVAPKKPAATLAAAPKQSTKKKRRRAR